MTDYSRFLSRGAESMQQSAIRQMGTVAAQMPDIISFAPGYPAADRFTWDAYREIAAELLTGHDGSVLQYGPTRGLRPLLETIGAEVGSRGIVAGLDELQVTTGSQQGLDLVARVLLDPGDVALVELPSYTGAITAFRNAQATLVGVRQDVHGIDLDHLRAVLATTREHGRRVKFLYVVPNFQNPTGQLLALARRTALLEWAAENDLLIVEDDPYGALYFEGAAAPSDTRPIKADDREGRVIYLSSFSKTLAPAFRVAWIVAPPSLAAKFETAKQALDLCTGSYDQRMVLEACRRGLLARQVPILRDHYREKCRTMERALHEELGDLLTWTSPRGGFFIWATLGHGLDGTTLLSRAMTHGVIYVAGRAFFVDGSGGATVRLAFSAASSDRIVEGVGRLAAAVSEALEQGRAEATTAAR